MVSGSPQFNAIPLCQLCEGLEDKNRLEIAYFSKHFRKVDNFSVLVVLCQVRRQNTHLHR